MVSVMNVPAVVDGLALEVVAEREVAQHLEEGVVARAGTHVLEVVVLAAHPHALLHDVAPGGRPASSRPRKVSLNCTMPALVNSSVGSVRHQRRAGHHRVAPFGKEVQKPLAYLDARHRPSSRKHKKNARPREDEQMPVVPPHFGAGRLHSSAALWRPAPLTVGFRPALVHVGYRPTPRGWPSAGPSHRASTLPGSLWSHPTYFVPVPGSSMMGGSIAPWRPDGQAQRLFSSLGAIRARAAQGGKRATMTGAALLPTRGTGDHARTGAVAPITPVGRLTSAHPEV